jgi:hypothetical protein
MSMDSRKIAEFLDSINKRFGVYLDSVQGFISNYQWFLQSQERVCQQFGFSIEQQDAASISRSNHPPSVDLEECERREKHRMTQAQYKKNNALGGLNHQIALEDCICASYDLWEEFKSHVLKKKGMSDKQIMPVMCYLKEIRDRLTHLKAHSQEGKFIAIYKLKYSDHTLPSFTREQNIALTSDDLDTIILEVRGGIQEIISN